jgi:hypothetical protein
MGATFSKDSARRHDGDNESSIAFSLSTTLDLYTHAIDKDKLAAQDQVMGAMIEVGSRELTRGRYPGPLGLWRDTRKDPEAYACKPKRSRRVGREGSGGLALATKKEAEHVMNAVASSRPLFGPR